MNMNKYTLFFGAIIMVVLGFTIGQQMNPQVAVALGLMWIGFSINN